jgi:hypothetical protein
VTPEANKPEAEPNKFNWNAAWGGALNGALAGGVVGGALLYLEYATCTMPAWLKGCTDAKETPLTDSDAGETDVVLTSCIGPNWKVALNEVPPNQAEERPPATAEGNQ